MNVNDAMETAAAYWAAHEQMQEPLFESEEVAVTLAREVERLRVWKTRWKDAAQKLRRQLEESGDGDTWRRACRRVELELEKTHTEVKRLRAELAAAKAASVCPVEIQSVYINKYLGSAVVFIGNEQGAVEFEAWMRDQMKERVDK